MQRRYCWLKSLTKVKQRITNERFVLFLKSLNRTARKLREQGYLVSIDWDKAIDVYLNDGYCPCVPGKVARCPCSYIVEDLEKFGRCRCGLFVLETKLKT